ncbi:ABC transporter ATP-binding protein [Candidatus Methanoperedens nitratireducens]|uniref:Phosphate import ATP-binding protein PstB 2 n=1 Tax=Candidatus Methanoperedens nitratireducens TaxID=1392998 RepID=A0A284VP83_9EURY|nr:phosphate ABC transporter ATP-binding protein [Candidatus Methanoperedens nitroreducens]SNQ61029.1 Phosphate import ATP-binding protein PstB 2 [Candidatus Methanoperedens nitroreducens]
MAEELIRIQSLCKSFGNKEVLKNVSLVINRGEIFALIGPSGMGKTTLLRILNFLETPSDGKLVFNGIHRCHEIDTRRRMSMLFQTPAIFNTSVFSNVAYGLEVRGADKNTIKEKVMNALNIVGLPGKELQKARTLSGGEAQRMAFARAIVYDPDILLLDEPTANLDPANVAKIEEIIEQIRSERGTTIVIATHNIYQVKRIADRVGILLNGELIEVNRKDGIFTAPKDARSAAFIRGEMIY